MGRYYDPKETKGKKVTWVKVVADSHSHVTEHAYPGDEWSRDSTATETTVTGIEIVKESSYYDVIALFEVDPSKEYYLVYVNYDTGDSFGRDDGQICYIDLFESKQLAQALVDAISADQNNYPDYFAQEYAFTEKQKADKKAGKKVEKKPRQKIWNEVTYQLDDGTQTTCYTGTWKGYFERYNYVEAVAVSVSGGKYRKY